MAESMSDNRNDAYAQFGKWLSGQPYWLQDATYRIYHGLEIDDAVISLYADMCIAQAKGERIEYKHIKPNESKGSESSSCIAVLKLTDIVGVNALASDANLEFLRDGVTVVYGLNGAGKSGFMRIFKQLSGSPYEETIQPNVFIKRSAVKPSCKFIVSEDDQEREIICDLASGKKELPLSSCDVFDTRISNDYITKTNNVSYQPFVFTHRTCCHCRENKQSYRSTHRSYSQYRYFNPRTFLGKRGCHLASESFAQHRFPCSGLLLVRGSAENN